MAELAGHQVGTSEGVRERGNLSAAGASQHEAWAEPLVGEPLAGTAFVVTSRDDSHR